MSRSISLQPINYADIPALAKISAECFLTDRHTQMKALGKNPYNHEEGTKEGLASYLVAERAVPLKAIDNTTGEILGWCGFAFRGFEKDEIPKTAPIDEPLPAPNVETIAANNEGPPSIEDDEDDIIKREMEMTDADMKHWMEKLMPPGTKCMYLIGLNVAPQYQHQGVGQAMLKWGAEVADKSGVFTWVHSSESAWKTYEKAGFEVIGCLDIDLDAWAPAPPPAEEGSGAVWGHYVLRYMKRLPQVKHGAS
ncbi:hypothetical protein BP6252_00411 [Coleophoma cylindrospora]|uniref:N-acetyltransferase domain-containing protein n=1 Tax=Coleophoma cylindrospora TaxID=1849047 RepID=A0A3D8SPX8_9HELO|nr:hypothetical protein BP6252_00411 [Coleophoma cylindrospora]